MSNEHLHPLFQTIVAPMTYPTEKFGFNVRHHNGLGEHVICERRSPNGHSLSCSCGWRHFVKRQNALARAAKVRAAIKGHLSSSDSGASR